MRVLQRLAADQILFAPVFTLMFFSSLHALEGRPEYLQTTLSSKFIPVLTTSWGVWVPAQLINFRFVRLEYRVRCVRDGLLRLSKLRSL